MCTFRLCHCADEPIRNCAPVPLLLKSSASCRTAVLSAKRHLVRIIEVEEASCRSRNASIVRNIRPPQTGALLAFRRGAAASRVRHCCPCRGESSCSHCLQPLTAKGCIDGKPRTCHVATKRSQATPAGTCPNTSHRIVEMLRFFCKRLVLP